MICCISNVQAQNTRTGGGYPSNTSDQSQGNNPLNFILDINDGSDSIPIVFTKRIDTDSFNYDKRALVSKFDHQYDFIRKQFPQHISLSNQGSSTRRIEESISTNIEYNMGFNQYDPYKKHIDSLKYFSLPKAISDLYFSPRGQGNFIVKALFANSFANDIDLTIDYHRINDEGIYLNQETQSTSLSAGLRFGKHDRLTTYLEFHANNHNEQHNGGVSNLAAFEGQFSSNRTSIPIFLESASTRHESFNYLVQENIILNKGKLLNSELIMSSHFEHGYFRFFDNNIQEIEREIYNDFLVDDRGIRTRINFRKFKNKVILNTNLKKSVSLDLGFKYNLLRIDDEVLSSRLNNIILNGKLQLDLAKDIRLIGDLDIGVGSNLGTLSFKSHISLPWNKYILLKGGFDFSRLQPSYLNENLQITGQSIWPNNNFDNIVQSNIWAKLGIPSIKSEVLLSQGIVDNVIFFTEDNDFQQADDLYTFIKLKVKNKLKYKSIILQNSLIIQNFNMNYFGLPDLFLESRLFFNFNLFKNSLNSQLGVDHRFIPDSQSVGFQPVVGQFFPIEGTTAYFPQIDAFGLFTISQFEFLIRAENIYNLISNEIYFPVENHPAYDFRIRIAASWFIRN